MTSEDAACGFIGFLVVFALRKATAPEVLNATPTTEERKRWQCAPKAHRRPVLDERFPTWQVRRAGPQPVGGFSVREKTLLLSFGDGEYRRLRPPLTRIPPGSKFHRSGAPDA